MFRAGGMGDNNELSKVCWRYISWRAWVIARKVPYAIDSRDPAISQSTILVESTLLALTKRHN